MKYLDTSYSQLGKKLRMARKEAGLTQAMLAEGIVTRNMLSRIESGEALPSLPTLLALAERLSRPVGYFIDDHDDGSHARNQRIMTMIREAFEEENYDICLQYCLSLDPSVEEREAMIARCHFELSRQKMYDGRLFDALTGFSDLLKRPSSLPPHLINEGKLYRALLSEFLSDPTSGKEESILHCLNRFADAPSDLVMLSVFLTVLKEKGRDCAAVLSSVLVFAERKYSLIADAKLALVSGDLDSAKRLFLESLGFQLPPPIHAYVLSCLEVCCSCLHDYENAYAYMNLRRTLVEEWTQKS